MLLGGDAPLLAGAARTGRRPNSPGLSHAEGVSPAKIGRIVIGRRCQRLRVQQLGKVQTDVFVRFRDPNFLRFNLLVAPTDLLVLVVLIDLLRWADGLADLRNRIVPFLSS
jgi:hypothetical protein